MIKTLMHHKVQDFTKWKEAFDGFYETRKAAGEIEAFVSTPEGDSNNVYVINTWPSMEAFQAFVSNPALEEGMKAGGVLEAPTTVIFA